MLVWMLNYCIQRSDWNYKIVLAEFMCWPKWSLIFYVLLHLGLRALPCYLPSHSRQWLVRGLEMPIWLPDEARSAEFAIHLFAKDVPQSIHSLFDCRWGTKCRCCAILAILPFVTLLIAEDEARSAELVQAILLSYLFLCILLNLSAFLISFLPISSRTQKHNFLFSFLYIILPLGTTK